MPTGSQPSPDDQRPVISLADARRHQGAQAERTVARHLWWRGWRICAKNWIGGGGELDLVVSRWRTIRIVEVRSRPTHAEAFASVDLAKLNRTRQAAAALVRQHKLTAYRLRIDCAAVDANGRIAWHTDVLAELPPAQ